MSKVTDLGIDAFGFGTESYTEVSCTESNDQLALMDDILALCDANESLDSQYAAGLVAGLDAVHNTYQMILLSTADTMLSNGTESSDLGVILSAAGLNQYSAGTETEYEGGLVEPFRKAGRWVSDTKPYKAVADSFVGKGIKAIVENIKKLLAWLKSIFFGKAKTKVNEAANAIAAEAPNHETHVQEAKKEEAEAEQEVKEINNASVENKEEVKNVVKKLARVVKIKEDAAAAIQTVAENPTDENKDKASKLICSVQAHEKLEVTAADFIEKALKTQPQTLDAYAARIVSALTNATYKYTKTTGGLASIVSKRGKSVNKHRGKKRGYGKMPGLLSEEIDLSTYFLMDGTESEMFDDMIDDYMDDGVEDVSIAIALAQYDMLLAIEAGVEAMTMEHFGHDYIGLDLANRKVYGVTPGMEAEDLAEAADDKKEEKKDEKKEEGGFKKALSKFGRGIKKAPRWTMKQIRKFVRWLMSKAVIIDRMFAKLSGLFSRNINVKDVFTGEKKEHITEMVIELVYNIKKASYDLDKLTNKESKAEEPNKDAITKDITEKMNKLEKVNNGQINNALDRIGLSDAAKELRVLQSKLSKGSLEKMVKKETINEETSKELATTMAGLNRASQKLGVVLRLLISNAKKSAESKKEEKKEEK